MVSADLNVFKGTPTVAVMDNRGLPIRSVQFNRKVAGEALDTLITRSVYNAIGQPKTSADPRLFDSGRVNQTQTQSLAGQLLCIDSVDAGSRIELTDITGAPCLEWDSRGTTRRYEYDDTLHRSVAIHERSEANGMTEQICERFVYAGLGDSDKNLNGQLLCHYDQGGLTEVTSISLTGQPLNQQRNLLNDKYIDSDWQGNDAEAWSELLDNNTYSTAWIYDALGTALSQKDANDNVQYSQYDVAGLLTATYYQASGRATQHVLSAIHYTANGQVMSETAGNGVVTTYEYDKQDWRLMQVLTTRPEKNRRNTLLQNLNYTYDPVGNIVSVNDSAQATRFYKNQRVTSKQAYTYDAIYQLITATGRENSTHLSQNGSLPSALPIGDKSQYTRYTRSYSYDRGGNLYTVTHNGTNTYTLDMVVSDKSNRAVQQRSVNPIAEDKVDSYFDAHGNLMKLEQSKNLVWGRHDQLKLVAVTGNQNEVYQYSGQGSRIRKYLSDNINESEVIYLPGLELRMKRNNGKLTEELHLVTLMNTGRNKVRELYWPEGKNKPENMKDHQLRYSLDNHLGSSNLELDENADILTLEEYYPFGGTALWSAKNDTEAKYKYVRYSGKERDMTGLYYYGHRYYMPWMGRWLNPDPGWTVDGPNLYCMVRNNPITMYDPSGLATTPTAFGNMKPNTSLKDIAMLGSHDSGTHDIDFLKGISVCQNSNLIEQKNAGVQYFDLRVRSNTKNDWHFYHGEKKLMGAIKGFTSPSDALPQIHELLDAAVADKNNIFIFKFHFDKNTNGKHDIKRFMSSVITSHAGSIVERDSHNSRLADVTPNNSVSAGKNLIILAHHAKGTQDDSFIWNYEDNTYGGWGKTPLRKKLGSFLQKNMSMGNTTRRLLISQMNLPACLPPQLKMFMTFRSFTGLRRLAKFSHRHVSDNVKSKAGEGYNPGILSGDYVGNHKASSTDQNMETVNQHNLQHRA
ncbi:TccC3 [Moritella sp. PE36]|uniref:RHS repeat-associated core domain-containing protein n=1 Tax=Moritella sp. PE36 TaxID=58051 RepID=UPI000156900D|nr:RHS repeat-associated core domain-containing protein [Moritella sp. PE36]EDM66215.1 TccC3 [Moritella sp. PE36]